MPADDRRPASQAPAHVRFVSLPLFCFLPFQRSGSTERNSSWLHAGAGSDTAGTLPRLPMCAQLLIDQALTSASPELSFLLATVQYSAARIMLELDASRRRKLEMLASRKQMLVGATTSTSRDFE